MPRLPWHQVEIAVGFGSTALLLLLAPDGVRSAVWPAGTIFVIEFLLLAQPLALLRLVEYFRPVSPQVRWGTVGLSAAALLALLGLPYPRPVAFPIATAAYFGAVQAYVAWLLLDESRRRMGVTRRRLVLASAGGALAVALVVHEGVAWLTGTRLVLPAQALLAVGLLVGYGLGHAPPRGLLRSWQRSEFIQFLVRTAERPPDERADRVAQDLNDAVMRSVTAVTATVFLGRDELSAYATSDPIWGPVVVSPDAGLVGIGLGGAEPVVGPPDEAEPPLNDMAEGQVVIVVPIGRSAPRWGALVVVERRPSVYQPEELSHLGTLSAHASDILDYARLSHRERAEQELPDSAPPEPEPEGEPAVFQT